MNKLRAHTAPLTERRTHARRIHEESASICAKVRKLLGAAGETFGAVRTRGSR